MNEKTKQSETATDPAPIIEKCATCLHYFPDDKLLARQGLCDANPPTATFVPMQDAQGNAGLALQPIRPPVGAEHWCGQWRFGVNPVYARERARGEQGKKPN